MSEPFIAEIKIFGGNFAPRGYAFCNGQLLPIAQNTALFALIGMTYGGDGRTTTGLPNLQGRLPMHPGRGPGLTDRRLGERGGSEAATLAGAQVAAHSHAAGSTGNPAAVPAKCSSARANHGFEGGYLAGALDAPRYSASAPDVALQTDSGDLRAATVNTGNGQPHQNMPPYLAVNFIIALQGLFPSRS